MTKLHLAITLTLVTYFSGAPPLRADCSTPSSTTRAVQEQLGGIGFSDNQDVFAYLLQGYSEGIGSYFWEMTVQELTSAKVVDRVKLLGEQEPQRDPPIDFQDKAKKLLEKYDITLKTDSVRHFPLISDVGTVDAQALTGTVSNDSGVIKTDIDILLIDNQFNFERIGTVSKIDFFGHLKLFDHKVAGYFREDNSGRLVAIVEYKDQANEASDIICTYRLFGARLPVEEKPPKTKVRLLESLMSIYPERPDIYLHLGDNYWQLGSKSNAETAYRTYLKKREAIGEDEGVPSRVLKRLELPLES